MICRWLLVGSAAAAAFACGGATHRERADAAEAGAAAVSADCRTTECAGEPCEAADTCGDALYYNKACLPEACGLPSVCRYRQVTAMAELRSLVCTCAGTMDIASIGWLPAVFAYVYQPRFPECSPGYEEVCERSKLVGVACDPTLSEAPELAPVVTGSGLPFEDGVGLLAFDLGTTAPLLGSGTINGGAVSFALARAPGASLVFLADENGDGSCTPGERILRHARELAPLEGLLRLVPVAEAEIIACEQRLTPA